MNTAIALKETLKTAEIAKITGCSYETQHLDIWSRAEDRGSKETL